VRTSMVIVQEIFPEHIISLRGELPCPSHSPAACDYFLWGYLKAKVYTTRPRTIDDLKIAIQWYQKTWREEQGWKSVYAVMDNILVMCCPKRNKQKMKCMWNKMAFNDYFVTVS
jgi:hypothetical protein